MEGVSNSIQTHVVTPAQDLFAKGVDGYHSLSHKFENWSGQFLEKAPYRRQVKSILGKLFLGLPVIAALAVNPTTLTVAMAAGTAALYTMKPEYFQGQTWNQVAPMLLLGGGFAAGYVGATGTLGALGHRSLIQLISGLSFSALSIGLFSKANEWQNAQRA